MRELVLASVTYKLDGVHPGLMEGLAEMKPEMMYGSPWHEEYMRIAPRPEDFATLFAKKTQMDRETQDLPTEAIEALDAPTLLIIGDSDIVRPEHAVEMFRLLGGVLCLCPNHHVLFDHGGVVVAEDLSLIGVRGRLTVRPRHHLSEEHLSYRREHYRADA